MARGDEKQSPGEDGAALRGLTGRGPSQVGVDGAMRARDVSRPNAAHLSAAEALELDVASRRQQRRRTAVKPSGRDGGRDGGRVTEGSPRG